MTYAWPKENPHDAARPRSELHETLLDEWSNHFPFPGEELRADVLLGLLARGLTATQFRDALRDLVEKGVEITNPAGWFVWRCKKVLAR